MSYDLRSLLVIVFNFLSLLIIANMFRISDGQGEGREGRMHPLPEEEETVSKEYSMFLSPNAMHSGTVAAILVKSL